MTFTESIRTCLTRKYANFRDRAPRSEYWWFVLFGIIVSFIAGFLDSALGLAPEVTVDPEDPFTTGMQPTGPIAAIIGLALVIPNIAVTARRLHDVGRSGWWMLLPAAVIFGGAVFILLAPALFIVLAIAAIAAGLLLLWWMVKPSEPGPNRWGPNPFEDDVPPPGGTYAASRVPSVDR